MGIVMVEQETEFFTKEEDEPLISTFPECEEKEEDPNKHVLLQSRKDKVEDYKVTGFMVLLALTAALGGFLFGYDTGVVSGAMLEIRRTFSLSSTWLELIVSVTIVSAAVSSFTAGFLCDVLGRRFTLLTSSIMFTVGAAIMAVSYYPQVLLIGRVTVGVGIGLAAMAVPLYIAELAPSNSRGRLVVIGCIFLTGGQFTATVVCGIFSYMPYDIGWRFMLGLAGVPSLLMFVGFLFMPESPRWLVFHGESEKAQGVLVKIRPRDAVAMEMFGIMKDYKDYHQRSKMGMHVCYCDWDLTEGRLAVKICILT